jgi:hypothetical protein
LLPTHGVLLWRRLDERSHGHKEEKGATAVAVKKKKRRPQHKKF